MTSISIPPSRACSGSASPTNFDRVIAAPKHRNDHLASAWTAGIAVAMLAVGIHGAAQPILPEAEASAFKPDFGEEVALEDFALPASAENETPETPPIEEPDVEIPPVPVIEQPIQPPEMAELVPLENPPPAPRPVASPPPPKPRPQTTARPAATPGPSTNRGGGGGGPVTTFTGGGGRFPYPAYPAFARSAKQQGTVRLLHQTSDAPSS